MNNKSWEKIELIFQDALNLRLEDRNSFVERECVDNSSLLNEVKSLLESFENDTELLDQHVFELGLEAINDKPEKDFSGTTIGFYEIQKKIGAGGMGEVYRAVDTRLNRVVALKFLSESFENDNSAKRRLIKEAQAVAMLEHPNICAVHGIEQMGEHHFIVMQYIEGKTLGEDIDHQKIDAERFEFLARQIISAVAFAHSHGVIHRDLKPGNIMISGDNQVKVLDFGLAKILEEKHIGGIDKEVEASQLSQNGLIIGTVSYMSPEQLRGEKLDYRSDIFSVGIILYELLARQNPFNQPSQAETIASILTVELSSFDKPLRNFPKKYFDLVEKCLQKNKELRFQSAAEILVEMDKQKSFDLSFLNKRSRLLFKSVFAAAILLAVFAALFLFTEKPSPQSLAILPIIFENPPLDKEYLADGLTKGLIDKLSGLSDLKIVSEFLTTRYNSKTDEPLTFGQKLNADAVLSGEIIQRDNNLFLKTKLIRISDGFLMDDQEMKIEQKNLIDTQKTVSEHIIGKIKTNLTVEDKNKLQKNDTESTEAKNYYLQGRFYLKRNKDSSDLEKAIESFTNAKDIDQNYAQAWAGLADAYLSQAAPGVKNAITPEKAVESAKLSANRAIELDNTLPETYNSLGWISLKYDWNWQGAENYFRTAINLKSDFLPARFGLINVLKMKEKYEEALEQANKIKEFDPLSVSSDIQIALIHYRKRDFEQAYKILSDLHQRFPNDRRVNYVRVYDLIKLQKLEEAVEILKPLYDSDVEADKVFAAAPLGFIYAKMGKRDEASKIIRDLDNFSSNNYVPAQEKALIYVGLGNYDKVFEYLDSSCKERFSSLPGWVSDPIVDEVKTDPRFDKIKKCVNL